MSLGTILPAVTIGLGAIMLRPRRGLFPYNTEGEALAPIVAQATVDERHIDRLRVTHHPVESGAAIADHAYKEPSEVIIRAGWSNSPSGPGSLVGTAVGLGTAVFGRGTPILASIPSTIKGVQSILAGDSQAQVKALYQQLLQLQESRVPFDVYTGKRVYRNMLMTSLSVMTNEASENSLPVEMHCQQVLIAETSTVTIPSDRNAMTIPEETAPTKDLGKVSLEPAPTITPTPQMLIGSLSDTSTSMATLQTTMDPLTGLQGALAQMTPALGAAQDAVQGLMTTLPTPFSIPFEAGTPQSFDIDLGGVDFAGAQKGALESARSALEDVNLTAIRAEQQIPLVSGLPDDLKSQITSARATVTNALEQLRRVTP